ncbi:interleukin-20 receptor subunit alpha-like [Pelodytes ibericus]
MLLIIFLLLTSATASAKRKCTLPRPENVYFTSINMKNVLNWSAPNVTDNVLYTVQYSIYGNGTWQNKLECTKISRTICDLSNETSDTRYQYYARVLVIGKCCCTSPKTERFIPVINTIIGPPTINVIPGDKSLLVKAYYPDFHLEQNFKGMEYIISIKNTRTQHAWTTKKFSEQNLDPNTTYCVTVTVHIHVPLKHSPPSPEACVTTPEDRSSEEAAGIISYIVLPIILIITIIVSIVCGIFKYIHVSQLTQPQILNLSGGKNNGILHVEAYVAINFTTIDPCKLKMLEASISSKPKPDIQTESEVQVTKTEGKTSHETAMVEKGSLGYRTLQVERPTSEIKVTPYDMPHQPHPSTQLAAPSFSEDSENLIYGRIKRICCSSPMEQVGTSGITKNTCTLQPPSVNYVPKMVDNSAIHYLGSSKECHSEIQHADQVIEYVQESTKQILTNCNSLFINWTPAAPPLNLHKVLTKEVEKDRAEDATDLKESLLSKLYKPLKMDDSTEEDELLELERRWELHVHMAE